MEIALQSCLLTPSLSSLPVLGLLLARGSLCQRFMKSEIVVARSLCQHYFIIYIILILYIIGAGQSNTRTRPGFKKNPKSVPYPFRKIISRPIRDGAGRDGYPK
ncbi:unnamed protein product, partial [Vitis vinifera]